MFSTPVDDGNYNQPKAQQSQRSDKPKRMPSPVTVVYRFLSNSPRLQKIRMVYFFIHINIFRCRSTPTSSVFFLFFFRAASLQTTITENGPSRVPPHARRSQYPSARSLPVKAPLACDNHIQGTGCLLRLSNPDNDERHIALP